MSAQRQAHPELPGPDPATCDHCSARPGCLAGSLSPPDRQALDAAAERGRPLAKGELAYVQGQPFRALFLVRSGLLKTFSESCGEEHRIQAFLAPGDLLGLDAISGGRHGESAEVLDTTSLCAFPFEPLSRLSGAHPALRRELLRAMSWGLRRSEAWHRLLGMRSAERRLAAFLVELAERLPATGGSGRGRATLPIPKRDLANYLGLAPETVSRGLARLQRRGLAQVTKRSLCVTDQDGLTRLTLALGQGIEPETEAMS